MTITDAQIEAAAEALSLAQARNGSRLYPALFDLIGHCGPDADLAIFRAAARAALEAGEAAAWSTDFDYAPQDGTDIAAETNDGLVLSVHGKEGEWTNGRHVISGLKRWAHLPTPPTEGDR